MNLLDWYNLVFVAPVGLAGIYLVLSAVGLGSEVQDADVDHDVDLAHDVDMDHDIDLAHDVDIDHDIDLAHDVDVDHDVDLGADHDLDVEHDVDMEHDIDHDVAADHDLESEHAPGHGVEHEAHEAVTGQHSLLIRMLSVLGFGKVPVSILMTCLMVLFGATGLIANGVFSHLLPFSWGPTIYFWPSLGLAVLASLTLTGTFARGLSRIMPTRETYAVTEEELVGRVGTVVYGIREGTRGEVHVKDEGGTLHQVMGRTMAGGIPKAAEVILVRYHREGDYYDVSASPLSDNVAHADGRAGGKGFDGAEDVQARRFGQRPSAARDADVLSQQ